MQTPLLLAAVLGAAWLSGQTASTQARSRLREVIDGREVVSGEVLLKFRNPPGPENQQIEQQIDSDESREIGRHLGVVRLHSRSYDTASLLSFLRTHPGVEYVEPNYILHADTTPNDPQFGHLWGLLNTGQVVSTITGTPGADIHAPNAWNITIGSTANVIAVIDTGIDYSHEDLRPNVWIAPASFQVTIGGLTITCAAGTHGFNAITNTCDPLDDNNHGSHVSGTIGAVGNNGTGVTGVNWTASIMASKFLDATGSGTLANAVNAIEFAIQAKAAFGGATGSANVRVLNNSWGGGGFTQTLLDEINKAGANDMLFVAAAGNNSQSNDTWAFFPADYTAYGAQNIVAVAATDSNDQLASFSNYGSSLVHLGAPGVNILSTTIGNTYQYFSGTSMATPHVSGAAALVLSKCTFTAAALKSNLLNNVDVVSGLIGWVSTNGRLNVDKAIRACQPVPPASPANVLATAGNAQVSLTWSSSSGATSYNVKRGTASGSETLLVSGVTGAGYTDTTTANGTTYFYVVTAVNSIGESQPSAEVSATPTAPVAPPLAPTVDKVVFSDGSGTRTTPSFSTSSAAEILLAFAASDGPSSGGQTLTVTGAGLTWSLVRRVNTPLGTAEVWKATAPATLTNVTVTATPSSGGYQQSLTVVTFAGAAGVGAIGGASGPNGAPTVSLTTTQAGSLVYGVGNDWSTATARTVGANQALVHQYLATQGDTLWVQKQIDAVALAGSVVQLTDTAPTTDRWNFAAVEIVPSGPQPQVTVPNVVNLTQSAAATAITGAGLTVGTVTTASSSTVPAGSVIGQTPIAGSQVASGSAVDLVVSSGPSAALAVDKVVFSDGSGTRTTASFSTSGAGEVLIAFAASDGPSSGTQALTVSGAGLSWSLVKRANTQRGTSEIWAASAANQLLNVTVSSTQTAAGYHQSLTVVAFTGAGGFGASAVAAAATGAPAVSLTTTKTGSLVYGVGNDWDNAIARVVGANQVMVHQWVDSGTGDTYWVQAMSGAVAAAGSAIQLNDTSPTTDRWNLAAVEILTK